MLDHINHPLKCGAHYINFVIHSAYNAWWLWSHDSLLSVWCIIILKRFDCFVVFSMLARCQHIHPMGSTRDCHARDSCWYGNILGGWLEGWPVLILKALNGTDSLAYHLDTVMLDIGWSRYEAPWCIYYWALMYLNTNKSQYFIG